MLKRIDKVQPKSEVNRTINYNIEQHLKQGDKDNPLQNF